MLLELLLSGKGLVISEKLTIVAIVLFLSLIQKIFRLL